MANSSTLKVSLEKRVITAHKESESDLLGVEALDVGVSNGGLLPLEIFIEMSRLPQVCGVPAKVMWVIERRIGKASLSINAVADELGVSTRTLQRHLNQQQICFTELRDQVRFHFAVSYLLKGKISIDRLSLILDFSDRTGFTNAFKRWSGLSPSVFRRRYRRVI